MPSKISVGTESSQRSLYTELAPIRAPSAMIPAKSHFRWLVRLAVRRNEPRRLELGIGSIKGITMLPEPDDRNHRCSQFATNAGIRSHFQRIPDKSLVDRT